MSSLREEILWREMRPDGVDAYTLAGALEDLSRARGEGAWLDRAPLLPNERDFPDRWSGDVRSVERLLRRLMRHAGLGDLDLVLDVVFAEELGIEKRVESLDPTGRTGAWHAHGTAAWFAGIDDSTCFFGVREDLIGDAAGVVAVLAHEVCHAYRRHHELEVRDRDLEELLTDATTVFLGFGVLTTNAAERHHSEPIAGSSISGMRWGHQRLGYLDATTFAALLAHQSWRREASTSEVRAIAAALEPNQRDAYRRVLDALRAGLDEHAAFSRAAPSDRRAALSVALFVLVPIALIALVALLRYLTL